MDLIVLRRIGSVVLAFLAITILVGAAPPDRSDEISEILSDDRSNQSRAEGAPQQAVVNGWTSRDLLQTIALQTGPDRDDRPTYLLGLAVLQLALMGLTSQGKRTGNRLSEPAVTGLSTPSIHTGHQANWASNPGRAGGPDQQPWVQQQAHRPSPPSPEQPGSHTSS